MWCKYVIFAPHSFISNTMATVTAFLRVSTKKTTTANVRFRLRDGRNLQLFHKSNIVVNPSHWDSEKECIKSKITFPEIERAKFNKSIADRKNLIANIYNQNLNKSELTSKWLEDEINKALHPENFIEEKNKPKTLFEFIEYFISIAPTRKDKVTGRKLSFNNIQQYKATEKHLKLFAKQIGKADFNFNQIDQSFYDKFVDYLQKPILATDRHGNPIFDSEGEQLAVKKSFTQNSVGKHIRVLKLILNEATREGVNPGQYYNQFHVFTEDADAIYLNEEELKKLKDYDFSNDAYLERVRDWFLLLAWTGSRFSDLEKISKTDIKDGFITFRQQKTNTKVTIPLHPVVSEILEKYNYEMPEPISNQKFNDYIKIAAEKAEINELETITKTVGGKLDTKKFHKYELISSHTGRRSFCTNMYKRGLPTLMIMSISGHKTEKSFLKYIRVKQQEHAEMMAKAWESIYKKA